MSACKANELFVCVNPVQYQWVLCAATVLNIAHVLSHLILTQPYELCNSCFTDQKTTK